MSAKRAVDVLGAVLLLLLLGPPLLAVAATAAVITRGPLLARRERRGHDGRTFAMLLFRAPGTTRAGRWLRHHHLDGLPGLINVVRGEMSLVGPFPLAPGTPLTGMERARAAVRPGVTGPWQIGGRSELPWEEMAVLDLHYAEEHWLGMDLRVLARTVPLVVRGGHPPRAVATDPGTDPPGLPHTRTHTRTRTHRCATAAGGGPGEGAEPASAAAVGAAGAAGAAGATRRP